MSEIKLQHEKNFEKFDNHSEFVHALSSKQYPSKEENKTKVSHAITLGMSVKINSNTRLRKYI